MNLSNKKILNIFSFLLNSVLILFLAFPLNNVSASLFTSVQDGQWEDGATWHGTDYSSFPVLFSGTYAYLATVANGGRVQNSNGYDIIFASDSACTTQLNHELESYNATTGNIVAWVNVPTLNYAADTTFYVCYGNSSISTNQSNPTGVWDSSFKGVWHLPNGSSLTANDSTGVNNGTVTAATATTGKIDGAASFNGTTAKINAGTNASLNITSQPITISAWINPTTFGGNSRGRIVDKLAGSTSGYTFFVDNGNVASGLGFATNAGNGFTNLAVSNASAITTGVLQYVTAVYNNNKVNFYVNGVAKGSPSVTENPTTNSNSFVIGARSNDTARSFNGVIDEVRISNVARSLDWITTEYNNQSSPSTFYAVGSEVGGGTPYVYERPITIDHTKVSNTSPTKTDDVLIANTTSVTVPASTNVSAKTLTIDTGGTLIQGADSSITYYNSFTNNGTYTPDASAVMTQALDPDLEDSSDTGDSNTDDTTTDDTPTFDISCSAGSTVELISGVDNAILASGICGVNNTITLTTSLLTIGTYNVYARETDGDGSRRFLTRVNVLDAFNGRSYNDNQKFVAIGADGFARFVYWDNDPSDIHFVQCTNGDCSTKVNTTIATGVGSADLPTLVMGSDGFARIVYNNYSDKHFVRCTNDSCSLNTDIAFDVIGGSGYYEHGFALDTNDLASIAYNDYDNSVIRFSHCTNQDCSSVTSNDVATFDYGSSFGMSIADDGFARFAYFDDAPDNDIHFVQCLDVTCLTKTNTTVVTGLSDTGYYVDMVLGEDGFGRISYMVNTENTQNFIRCTNIDCSTHVVTQIGSSSDGQSSIVMGNDDFARIAYADGIYGARGGIVYVECTNADCTTKNTDQVDPAGYYPVSMAIDEDGFAKILYGDLDSTKIYLASHDKIVLVVEAPLRRRTTSGSSISPNRILAVPVLPTTPTSNPPCPLGDRFSAVTGLPCVSFYQPLPIVPNVPSTNLGCAIVQTLAIKAWGGEVKCLQQILNGAVFPNPNLLLDGIFGLNTKNAVVLFQKSRGLLPDGIVGPNTRAELYK